MPMGRSRTQLELTAEERAQLDRLLHRCCDPRERQRLQIVKWATSGRYTLEELARKAGRSRSTIQNWMRKFGAGGMAELLRRETPPGSWSPVGDPGIQAELEAGLASGRLTSAAGVASWLRESHGIRRSRKSVYYWLWKRSLRTPYTRKRATTRKHRPQ
jgi:transposase-like protein